VVAFDDFVSGPPIAHAIVAHEARRKNDGDDMRARLILCGLLISVAPIRAREPLLLRVSPAVCFAPANLVVRTTIEADAANRAVEIVAESPEFYRSSEVQLDGDNAPRTTTFEFRSLPSGTYQVKATLIGENGKPRAYVHQEVNVIAGGGGR
jgi:hypothetical protein